MIATMAGYELDDDPARVDRDTVRHLLATEAYRGRWRGREHVEQQIAGAWRVTGAYDSAGRTVGFARAISDAVAFAYLADVIVDPVARGHGLGVGLVELMIDDGPGRDFRWTLHTADAHDLYERFGFAPPDSNFLERRSAGAPQ